MGTKKAIRLNLSSDPILMICSNKLNSNLCIISCIKAQKFPRKECRAFLVHVIIGKWYVEDLESIPEVCNLSDVPPEELSRISSERLVEYRIDLIPGATPVAKPP